MANTLKFKRGLLAGLPSAAVGEPLFTTDTFDLYIGTASGTQKYQKFIASGTTSQLLRGDGSLLTMPIVLSSPANGEVLKYNGTNWVNSADAGVTGSGVAGQVTYWGSSSSITGSNNLFWDNTNVRLGINTASPQRTLHLVGSGDTYIRVDGQSFQSLFGTDNVGAYIGMQSNAAMRFITNATERMRLHAGGNLHLGGTSDNGLRFQVTGDGYFSGSLGIGSSSLTGYGVRNSRTITGALACYGFSVDGTIQSDATSSINIFNSVPATQAAAFNIGSLIHFIANQGTQGAGSTISNQYGFLAQAGLTGATNNYGFFGNIASGTGRWNLYMNGTAANYLAGNLWIGTTSGNHPLEVASAGNTILYIRAGATSLSRLVFGTSTNTDRGFIDYDNTAASRNMSFKIAEVERMRLDASGNLGLGVTPSAWGTTNSVRAIQLASGSIWNFSTTNFFIGQNYFYDGTNRVYVNTNAATEYAQITGRHIWYNAPSGTAGTTATLTERMRLDENGNLGLGVTPSFKLDVVSSSGYNSIVGRGASGSYFETYTIGGTRHSSFGSESNGDVYLGARANNPMLFLTNNTVQMRLFANGNLGVGVSSDAGFKLDVNGTMRVSGASTITNGTLPSLKINHTASGHASAWFDTNEFGLLISSASTSASHYLVNMTSNSVSRFRVGCDGAATFSSSVTANGGVILGHTGGLAITFPGGQAFRSNGGIFIDYGNGGTGDLVFRRGAGVTNTLTLAVADGAATFSSSVTAGGNLLLTAGTASSVGAINLIRTGTSPVASRLTFGTDGTGYSFAIGKNQGGTVTDLLTILDSGAATFSSSVTLSGNLTVDTNTLFVDSSANRVGIGTASPLYALHVTGDGYFGDNVRFPNLKGCVFVQTGGTLLGSIAMDSGNAVTIDNNGFAGLSVGGSYTMTGGNLGIGHSAFGTSATKTISVNSGTAPSTSPADAFQLYSADITAGNAAPHFRTENGGIIKLYQQTTGVTSATYIGGAGTGLTDSDTFDGYTIAQIVKALRNAGLLA